jgi:hypothetical protein
MLVENIESSVSEIEEMLLLITAAIARVLVILHQLFRLQIPQSNIKGVRCHLYWQGLCYWGGT